MIMALHCMHWRWQSEHHDMMVARTAANHRENKQHFKRLLFLIEQLLDFVITPFQNTAKSLIHI